MQMFLSYANRNQLFALVIKNVKVMRNAKIHELKTIMKLTFVKESGPATSR